MQQQVGEAQRLAVLHGYDLLDTPNEPQFDAIVRTAAAFLKTPIALISLLDEDRQWFKARFGIEVTQTARSISFCTYAIQQAGLLQITDAREDPRFAENPSVTGDPHVRFYAGMPLTAECGARIGTLCVADTEPRPLLDTRQMRLLHTLASRTMTAFALRRETLHRYRELAGLAS